MASVAESSVSSVPLASLAYLQDQLLLRRDTPDMRNDTSNTDRDRHAPTQTNDDELEATVPVSIDSHRTPPTAHHPPPRLASSKSAPQMEMEAMVHASPSQDAFAAMTRATSFHGYPGGDTQPMDSQVYRDYTESMAKSNTTTPKKVLLNFHKSKMEERANTRDTQATEKSVGTCVEGDTGYIDLAHAWQPGSPSAQSATSDIEDLLASEHTQTQNGFARPKMPATPSLAGHKRNSSREMPTSAATTGRKSSPRFSQLFGGDKGAVLSGTQLFNQTQAPSSPVPEVPRSDPVLSRPSPNLQNQYSVSSPNLMISSPASARYDRPPATAREPRETYTSTRESQERRAAKLRKELGLHERLSDDFLEELEEEDNERRRRFEQKRLQRVQSDQALHEWSKLGAPVRSGKRPHSSPKPGTTIDLVTPSTTRKAGVVAFEVLDDEEEADGTGDVEQHDHRNVGDEQMEDNGGDQAEQSDADEYDELGQTVRRSQGPGLDDEEDMQSLAEDAGEDQDDASEHDDANVLHKKPQMDVLAQGLGASSVDVVQDSRTQSATQQSAIADSQPARQERARSLLPPQEQSVSSSAPLFVPGSQYAGKTSQDQAQIKRRQSDRGRSTQGRIASSPAFQQAINSVPGESNEASLARRDMLARFHPPNDATPEQEIPESDLPTAEGDAEQTHNKTKSGTAAQAGPPTIRSTPQEKIMLRSPTKTQTSQHSTKPLSQTPRTAAGVRHFTDLADGPSPRRSSAEASFDVDALMSDVMTADDQQYLEAVSSPPRQRPFKRRKVAPQVSKRVFSPQIDETVLEDAPGDDEGNKPLDDHVEPVVYGEDGGEREDGRPRAMRRSPRETREVPATTPNSVKLREQAGSDAASQLLARRSSRPSARDTNTSRDKDHTDVDKLPKRRLVKYGKKKAASKKSAVKPGVALDVDHHSPMVLVGGAGTTEKVEAAPAARGQDLRESENLAPVSDDGAAPTWAAPNRVFALFKGSFNNFYPATHLVSGQDMATHRVKFDDTTVTSLEAHHVGRLELRVGDVIKVDVSGMRTKSWVVKDFGAVAQNDEERTMGTDVNGCLTVKVQAKAPRSSLPASTAPDQGVGETVDVAISAIYVTTTMWSHFRDRTFEPPASHKPQSSRVATPSSEMETPDVECPASRSRRFAAKGLTGRASHLREGSVSSGTASNRPSLFSGMAFAISYGSEEAKKASTTRLIKSHGGAIIEDSFEEMFNLSFLHSSRPNSPPKKSSRKSTSSDGELPLQLRSEYANLGFVALITDTHSRRPKYIQALALGLPTLSGKWITDSLNPTKNPNLHDPDAAPLPWTRYLLPAGQSAYLEGAVRSRTMSPYSVADAQLASTIASRDVLLASSGVLIVEAKKGKGAGDKRGGGTGWDKHRAYHFLTLALGAVSVKPVADLDEAKALITAAPGKWRFVYVDGAVDAAGGVLFGKTARAGSKRARGEREARGDGNCLEVGGLRVVNDEFVIQSLILGALVG